MTLQYKAVVYHRLKITYIIITIICFHYYRLHNTTYYIYIVYQKVQKYSYNIEFTNMNKRKYCGIHKNFDTAVSLRSLAVWYLEIYLLSL